MIFFTYNDAEETNNSQKTLIKYPKLKRLKKITWNEGSINFIYGLDRIDAIGEKALTEIIIKNKKGNIIKHFKLDYSYFVANSFMDGLYGFTSPRILKLNKISQINLTNTEKLTHKFDYIESTQFPPRRTSFQDYLGYYNGMNITPGYSGFHSLKLYFYPNQGVNSYLPFRKTTATTQQIIDYPGAKHLDPNNNSLIGMLNKVTYPTGGYSTFIFENPKFRFEGADYIAGGARIKKQIINDGNGNQQILNYTYTLPNGNSSGEISSIPVFAYPSGNNFLKPTFYNKSKSALELTKGSFVGYSRVLVKEIGNGYTEYLYSNVSQFPNQEETRSLVNPFSTGCNTFLLTNSAFPASGYTDNSIRRGSLLEKRIYNSSNVLLEKNTYEYKYTLFDSIKMPTKTKIYKEIFEYGDNSRATFEVNSSSTLKIERNLLEKEVTTSYFNGEQVVERKDFIYDSVYPLVKELKTIDGLDTYSTKIFYPFDNETSQYSFFLNNLLENNRIEEPIIIKKSKNNILLSTQKQLYSTFGSLTSKKTIETIKSNNTPNSSIIIDLRDNHNNILQYHLGGHSTDIRYSALIWGYNHTKPIAKIVGLAYDQIPSAQRTALANFDYTNGSEATLLALLNNLRNALPNAMVSTFTYKPLIGLSTMTDAKGQTSKYYYDSFNRLQYVKDAQGHILKENEYHYRDN